MEVFNQVTFCITVLNVIGGVLFGMALFCDKHPQPGVVISCGIQNGGVVVLNDDVVCRDVFFTAVVAELADEN